MLLKYILDKLNENNDDAQVYIKVSSSGNRKLEGRILEFRVQDIDNGKILVILNIGEEN